MNCVPLIHYSEFRRATQIIFRRVNGANKIKSGLTDGATICSNILTEESTLIISGLMHQAYNLSAVTLAQKSAF